VHEIYLKKIAEKLIEKNSLDSIEILEIVSGIACDLNNRKIYINTWDESVAEAASGPTDCDDDD
jgi:hypothetical protein